MRRMRGRAGLQSRQLKNGIAWGRCMGWNLSVQFTPPLSHRLGRYCVSTFVLRPGQHVHINKGRLHAFRKVVFEQLPKNDAHAELRSALMKEIGEPTAPLCISVAFDW